jgi:energy-coupling factor transporter transmembrane protein EcfT
MKTSNSSSGVSLFTLLLVAFIILKLCKVIAWSWLWVMGPLWIPISLFILAFTILKLWAYGMRYYNLNMAGKETREKYLRFEERVNEVNNIPKSGFQNKLDEMIKQNNFNR